MKKPVFIAVLTLIIESIFTFLISWKLSIRFIEIMFFTGLFCSVCLAWFTSNGSTISRFIDAQNSARTGIVQEREEFRFRNGPAFKASLLYLFVGLIFFILLITDIIAPVK
ncbi:hypothetical protein [Priestia megaterium]|uniref:hypothetical protein n=1 Tax=Priestia megaterium TaxID=1404 RepID=UPI0024529E7F|nr:hypothetical protein [Priestia megaterium]MDH3144343.1 hypothetical protein [Priestia megaterium]MED4240766.1 hypothetical protein [Priestia megaterium]MED4253398.1 hypothetical protein [Priestia megaterium]MED4267752.1 hypothetical protein [Priestia megaterium]MED4278390.1 hypothetical protein [Priestia megaterium]